MELIGQEHQEEIAKLAQFLTGKYSIEKLLGVGGMGNVYQVKSHDGGQYALKVTRSDLLSNSDTRQRLETELSVLKLLEHDNIVRLVDKHWVSDDMCYLVMELLHGGNVEEKLLNNGALSLDEAVKFIHQITLGMEYAHNNGVIHRDLKPANILLDKEGNVKITDFGLSKSDTFRMDLTKTGETVGTAYYMAPEQFRGEAPTKSMDIYSLGILAYELVTGLKPFENPNYVAVATMHFNEAIPKLKKINRKIPNWYQEFVEKCSEKKVKDRFSSMLEATQALEYFAFNHGIDLDNKVSKDPSQIINSMSAFSKIKFFFK